MRLPATARWIGLALLGLAIAAAVSIAASHLVSQQIGIASESITAGDRLAPAVRSASAGNGSGRAGKPRHTATTPAKAPTAQPPTETTATAPTTPAPSAPQPPVATTPAQPGGSGDDHGGHSGHRGGGADD
jgi:hypothetical protein